MIKNNIIDLIGNTPLIKLKYPSELTDCEIFGKAEFMNPGGSIKDRTALGIIQDAEKNKDKDAKPTGFKTPLPQLGFFGKIKKFITNVLLGWIVIRLLKCICLLLYLKSSFLTLV